MQIEGIVKDVSKQSSGKNTRGSWSMQWVEFVDGRRVKLWSRPDVSNAKNKFATIEGAVEDTDKDGKSCFTLKADEGSFRVQEREPGTQLPTGAVGGPTSTPTKTNVRTIDDYEVILSRAIATVSKEFKSQELAGDTVHAVAQVVTSYMAAYVRGDFAVPADETVDGEKIPF